LKVASGLFGIFGAVFAVLGLICGGGASCLGALGMGMSPSSTSAVSPEKFSQGVGAHLGCLMFLIPAAALAALVGGIVSFARPKVGGIIQLCACLATLGAYLVAAAYAGQQAGAEGVTASLMTFILGGFVPVILLGLGAAFGFRAERHSQAP